MCNMFMNTNMICIYSDTYMSHKCTYSSLFLPTYFYKPTRLARRAPANAFFESNLTRGKRGKTNSQQF